MIIFENDLLGNKDKLVRRKISLQSFKSPTEENELLYNREILGEEVS